MTTRRPTPRALSLLVALGAILLLGAAEPATVASAVADRGYYVESGAGISDAQASALVSQGRNAGYRLDLVVLASEPAGGATTMADAVADRVGDGTIVVLTPESVGYVTQNDGLTIDRLDEARDYANDRGGDDATYLGNFVDSLTGAASSSGGGGGLLFVGLIVGVLVVLAVVAIRRSSRKDEMNEAALVDEARREIRSQLDAAANEILDMADRVTVAGNATASDYYRKASATFDEVGDQVAGATTLAALEALSDRMDEAAWQLDATEALLEGRPAPAAPTKEEPSRCFFDPTHHPPYEDAEIQTATGTRKVKVCRADAERLKAGKQPDSRMIDVGGRKVPAASAPRSHGGLGMSGLDLFSVILGGLSQQMRWGTPTRRRGTGMGGPLFGGGSSPRPGGRVGRSGGGGGSRSGGGGSRSRGGGSRRR